MLSWSDHILFLVLALLFPIRGATFGYRRLVQADDKQVPRVRAMLYRQAITIQWVLTGALLVAWWAQGRMWTALGLAPRPTPGFLIGATVLVVVVVVMWFRRRRALARDESLARVRAQLRHVERMLPHTPQELREFFRLSVTAGICEEVLYRGYLIWYLSHGTNPWTASILAAVIFGVGHLYQGWRGILTTAIVGWVLSGIYLTTGSLYLGMIFHALTDMHSGHMAYVALTRAAAHRMPNTEPHEAVGVSAPLVSEPGDDGNRDAELGP